MGDIVQLLRDYSPENRQHVVHMGAAEIERLRTRVTALGRENDFLRARAGNDDKGCVYCGLGASEQGKCASGFPGCARADDQMLCREAGVGMERDELRARVAELGTDAARYRYLRQIDRSEEWEDLLARRPIWSAEDIDAAIDAALSQQEGGG